GSAAAALDPVPVPVAANRGVLACRRACFHAAPAALGRAAHPALDLPPQPDRAVGLGYAEHHPRRLADRLSRRARKPSARPATLQLAFTLGARPRREAPRARNRERDDDRYRLLLSRMAGPMRRAADGDLS